METTTKENVLSAIKEFYNHYVVETVSGNFQVFQSLSYGDMLISFLLLLFIMLFVFKWLWEVLR